MVESLVFQFVNLTNFRVLTFKRDTALGCKDILENNSLQHSWHKPRQKYI